MNPLKRDSLTRLGRKHLDPGDHLIRFYQIPLWSPEISGQSVMVTAGCVNPTLTNAVLSLCLADHLLRPRGTLILPVILTPA